MAASAGALAFSKRGERRMSAFSKLRVFLKEIPHIDFPFLSQAEVLDKPPVQRSLSEADYRQSA